MDIPALLYHAVERDDVQKVRQLLDLGADPNETYEDFVNISSRSILHVCCRRGSVECAKLLVSHGADALARDKYKMTPLVYAIISQYNKAAEILVQACPEVVHATDRSSKTPLHFAVESDCVDSVRVLLRHGADVNQRGLHGLTPLMTLVTTPSLKNRAFIGQLLTDPDSDVDIDLKDSHHQWTALQFSVIRRDMSMIHLLLHAGSDPNTVDVRGRTPITNLIRDHLRKESSCPHKDGAVHAILTTLVDGGAILDFNQSEEGNPLMTAVLLKNDNLAEYLLDMGADPNVKFPSGTTLLLESVSRNDFSTTWTLLTYNAKPHVLGTVEGVSYNLDPMELALLRGMSDFVHLFIHYGYKTSKLRRILNNEDSMIHKSLANHPDLLVYLQEYAYSPSTLFLTVLFFLRDILGRDIRNKVSSLPLPKSLRDSVLVNTYRQIEFATDVM
ncbi:hypothetical protein FSP39_006607 [Pinctada imbricata]|uniref:Uncharacterized protein n=1 Tax=Pinctada imbricata TaxID=66713 RepID=A0AA89C0P8_PINIB|nr:hypothetical protein FSP39_006607 [Pinctada imbricata]